ncbi:hypothetical protein BH23BAC3_BH23BAC3_21870 [soil metagenome]
MSHLNVPPTQNPMVEILLNCLHQDLSCYPSDQLLGLSSREWENLVDLSIQHRVVPLLYNRLANKDIRTKTGGYHQAVEKLQAYSRQVSKNNLLYYGQLRNLLNRLNQHGIPAIPLKGIYLAEKIYMNPGMREMNDMDVLFRRKDLESVFHILSDMSYKPIKPIETGKMSYFTRNSVHLPRLIKEDVAGFEIHWNIAKPGQNYSIDPEELWQRARPESIAGEEAMALAPEDLLLHLCFHTSYDHMFSFGMRPFYDIAEVVKFNRESIDWDQLTERAIRYRWTRGVYLAMVIARDFTGAEIPDHVFDQIKSTTCNSQMLLTAKVQILTDKETSKKVSMTMVDFVTADNNINRTKTVLSRIFLPKERMYSKYPIQPGSSKIYAYYIIRFWQMLLDHSLRLVRISRSKDELSGIVKRKQALHLWMNGEDKV